MPDIVSPEVRSRMMSGIRGKNTKLELFLRSQLHKKGFRFRIHDRSLPGKPDMVFPKRKAVLFFHGCFWHGHDCPLFRLPSTRPDFWCRKIGRNRELDQLAERKLKESGWRYGVVWECALRGPARLEPEKVIQRCSEWLKSARSRLEIRSR